MPRYVTRLRSPWSQERAFEFLSDLSNFEEWDPGVSASSQVDGEEPSVGASYDVTVHSIGKDLTMRYEITSMKAPRRVEMRSETSTLRSVDVIMVEPESDGCVVTYEADLALKGLLAIGNPVLGVFFGRIGDRAATGLRDVLEGVEV